MVLTTEDKEHIMYRIIATHRDGNRIVETYSANDVRTALVGVLQRNENYVKVECGRHWIARDEIERL